MTSETVAAGLIAVGIYVRISEDAIDSGLGVERQLADCAAVAERRGWREHVVYSDNDVSASRGKPRLAYSRMVADIQARRIQAVIVWDIDRLTRTPAELEHFIDLADSHQIALASVGGDIDLATPQGRLTARVKGAVARHEVEQSSRRIRRKSDELAERGLPHGRAAWGWVRIHEYDERGRKLASRDVLDPVPAALIAEAADRIIAGESVISIERDWQSRGVVNSAGQPWRTTTLRQMLLRPRNAGLREHRGQIVGKAQWEPAICREKWDQVVAVLSDPARVTTTGGDPRHLVSMIAKCGLCDGKMRSLLRRPNAAGVRVRQYHCTGCQRVGRKQEDVDALVEATLLKLLSTADSGKLFARRGSDPAAALVTMNSLKARLGIAADSFADGNITGEQLARITARLRPQLDDATAKYRQMLIEPDLADLVNPDIAARWDIIPLSRKRAVINYLFEIRILPTHRGGGMWRFDPRTVSINRRANVTDR